MVDTPEFTWLTSMDPLLRRQWLRDPLGIPTSLHDNETAAERYAREAEARRMAEAALGYVFARLKTNIGVDSAIELFKKFIPAPKPRRPGERGPTNQAADHDLLRAFDMIAESTQNPATAPRRVAIYFSENFPGKYGLSAEAIEKRIRRLITTRHKERQREQLHRQAMAEQLDEMRRKLAAQIGSEAAAKVFIDIPDDGQKP